MRTRDQAQRDASDLAARMGDGWETRVWENLGWHYDVVKGPVKIKPGYGGDKSRYTAWIEPNVVLNGPRMGIALQVIADGKEPEDALGNAVQDARTMISRMEGALAILNDTVSEHTPTTHSAGEVK